MRLQKSSLAFILYLASVVNSTPLEPLQPAHHKAVEVRQANGSTNTTGIEPPHNLLSIEEKCAIISTGAISLGAAAAAASYITTLIKGQSDNHSCATISGSVDRLNYQYSASGGNCDTTSEQKTIDAAVNKAIQFMEDKSVDAACFQLTHGGTWKGLLQLAAGHGQIVNNKCLSITYNIEI